MSWWVWVLAGLALLAVEVLTPGGFFVLFFGLGALVVGLLVAVGIGGPPWAQWLMFSVLSVVSLLLFRRRLIDFFRAGEGRGVGVETLIGDAGVLLEDVAPGAIGKAELRGTVWTVRGAEDRPLKRGQRVRVQRVEGLTLWVRSE
jgi:membrane protein implicated in regulation of membrane protease activity